MKKKKKKYLFSGTKAVIGKMMFDDARETSIKHLMGDISLNCDVLIWKPACCLYKCTYNKSVCLSKIVQWKKIIKGPKLAYVIN